MLKDTVSLVCSIFSCKFLLGCVLISLQSIDVQCRISLVQTSLGAVGELRSATSTLKLSDLMKAVAKEEKWSNLWLKTDENAATGPATQNQGKEVKAQLEDFL